MRNVSRSAPWPGGDRARGLAVTGVDGCAGGWVAVTLLADSQDAPGPDAPGQGERGRPAQTQVTVLIAVAPTLAGLGLGAVPPGGAVGIDIPLGLLAEGWRAADLTGKGLSAQAWGLRGKLLEADTYRRGSPRPLYEVHPELSFAALAGGAPLPVSKHTPAGLAARRELLRRAGLALPPRIAGAAENDLLDAAAVAWSARRIAAGEAVTLAGAGQRADDGTEIAIRY